MPGLERNIDAGVSGTTPESPLELAASGAAGGILPMPASVGSRRKHYLPTLDAWRAVAALLVVGCHSLGTISFQNIPWHGLYDPLVRWRPRLMGVFNGSLGVDLFFALSGFLITYLSIKEAESPGGFRLGAFWVRRVFRIVPLAWVYIGFFLIVAGAGWGAAPMPKGKIIAASFLFFVNYIEGQGIVPALLGHLWTLAMEMQFYFLWAVILKLVRPRLVPAAALIGIAMVILWRTTAWRMGLACDGLRLESRGDSLLWGALFGAMLAREAGQWIRDWMPAWCFAPFFLLLGYVADQHPAGYPAWQPFLCAVVVTLTVIHASKPGFRWMECGPLRFLGRISFSIYVWQQVLTGSGESNPALVSKLFFAPPWSLVWIIPVAWVSYQWIEAPGMRVGISISRRRGPEGNDLRSGRTG